METYIVDSFTNQPFKGNPAGVCFPDEALSDALMLAIAQELNLSETAFVRKHGAENVYSIRFFSPKKEIPLCGHATLASSKVLFEKFYFDELHFITIQSLDLLVRKLGDEIVMEFPVYDTVPGYVPPALLEALGIEKINNSAYNEETNILLIEISNAELLANLRPDFEELYRSHLDINGVLVTAPSSNAEFDFHSRYFWPWSGTNEDPVTGGTHTFLAKYWGDKLGKQKLKSFQSSARTGFMDLELLEGKLLIKSQANIVLQGNLRI